MLIPSVFVNLFRYPFNNEISKPCNHHSPFLAVYPLEIEVMLMKFLRDSLFLRARKHPEYKTLDRDLVHSRTW